MVSKGTFFAEQKTCTKKYVCKCCGNEVEIDDYAKEFDYCCFKCGDYHLRILDKKRQETAKWLLEKVRAGIKVRVAQHNACIDIKEYVSGCISGLNEALEIIKQLEEEYGK